MSSKLVDMLDYVPDEKVWNICQVLPQHRKNVLKHFQQMNMEAQTHRYRLQKRYKGLRSWQMVREIYRWDLQLRSFCHFSYDGHSIEDVEESLSNNMQSNHALAKAISKLRS